MCTPFKCVYVWFVHVELWGWSKVFLDYFPPYSLKQARSPIWTQELQGSIVSAFHGLKLEVVPVPTWHFDGWIPFLTFTSTFYLLNHPPQTIYMYPLHCFAFVFCSGLTISTCPASLREKFLFVCVFCLHTLQFACWPQRQEDGIGPHGAEITELLCSTGSGN